MSCWEVDGRLQRVGPGNNAIVCFRGRAVESVWPGVNAVARVPLRGDVSYWWRMSHWGLLQPLDLIM